MPKKANESFNENLEQDVTDEDFKAMENHLSAMEDHLFNAGVGILQAAKTQEELFNTSIEAIQEALKPGSTRVEDLSIEELRSSPLSLPSQSQPQEISLAAIWERLNKIEHQLEYLIDHLVAVPTAHNSAQSQARENTEQSVPDAPSLLESKWTEKSLKKAYKTLATVRSQFGIEAKTWKSAVNEVNSLKVP